MKLTLAVAASIVTFALSTAQAQQPTWTLVSNRMSAGRWAPASCLISASHSALIAGGYSYARRSCVASIDFFDESSGRFRHSHARMTYPRDFAQANLLPDGTVVICGGFNDIWASMNIAEIYNPSTDTCRLTSGKMNQRRELFQSVNLKDGTVLLIGGLDLWAKGTIASAEIYHPDTEKFTPTAGSLATDRFGHAACLLTDGRVLVVGGTHWNMTKHETTVLSSAEIYNPVTEAFSTCQGSLRTPRDRPTVTLLPNGTVLIVGGQGSGGKIVTTAEIFDPNTERFTTIESPPLTPRMAHDAVRIAGSNQVCIVGGWDATSKSTTATALLYDPNAREFAPLPNLPFAAHDETLIAFPDGEVIVAGGKSIESNRATSIDQGAVMRFDMKMRGEISRTQADH